MNTAGFSAGAKTAQSTMATLTGSVTSGLSSITSALGPVGAAFAGAFALHNAFAGARQQIQAEQKLAAVLNATGNAAGLSAQQIAAYASELQNATNFGDELTIGAASILATFKEIKGDTFKQALAVAQDLSVVIGQDLTSSVTQLGKALNDPIHGVTALRRVGVSFTQSQLEQIKTLQESNDILGAQKIILKELESEFGGAAAAVADPWTQFKNAIGDLGETLAMALLPAVNALSRGLTTLVGWLQNNSRAVVTIASGIIGLVAAMKAWAIGQAAVLALSGPAGWAALATGLAIATAAGLELSGAFDSITSSATSAAKAAGEIGKATGDWTDKWSSAAGELDRVIPLLNEIRERRDAFKNFPTLANSLTSPIKSALLEIARPVETPIDEAFGQLKAVQESERLGDISAEQSRRLQDVFKARIGELTGATKAIQAANKELDVLMGKTTTESAIEELRKSGATKEAIAEFAKIREQIDLAKKSQDDFNASVGNLAGIRQLNEEGQLVDAAKKAASTGPTSVALASSRDALSSIARGANSQQNKLLNESVKQSKIQEQMKDMIGDLPDQFGKSIKFEVASVV